MMLGKNASLRSYEQKLIWSHSQPVKKKIFRSRQLGFGLGLGLGSEFWLGWWPLLGVWLIMDKVWAKI